ncbi:DUF2771 domain-containing protein [Streptomyces sp. NPDC090025]|uniref:DUF2771 domain-containing protein n=1 Tax=Streptomyces sp. NPDC090025 TaxID=3365922 RepID=UPI0038347C36
MTVAFLTRKRRRAVAALGAVSAGLLVLSACDKPTPVATVTVGSSSVNSEAACYNDGKALPEKEIAACLNKKAGKTISVDPSDKVRFGVDPDVAENGWTIFLNGTNAEPEPFKKTYRTIPASAFFSSQTGEATSQTQVTLVESSGKSVTGIWSFELKKKDS